MQHHGIQTRLIDWTEVLVIAVYFALVSYIKELSWLWAQDEVSLGRKAYPLQYHDISNLPTPAIWIINPYKLARQPTGDNILWSPGNDLSSDYFYKFFEGRDWPFRKPVPMYSPWENPLIAAQQGIFTVHGRCRDALECQIKNDTLRIEIPHEAAIFGTKLIKSLSVWTILRCLGT